MESDRIDDDSSDEVEEGNSDYSLADSYDEEVAEVHEHENKLAAEAEKEKIKLGIVPLSSQKNQSTVIHDSSLASQTVNNNSTITSPHRQKKQPSKSMSAKFDVQQMFSGLINNEDEQEFETNLQNFDVEQQPRR